MMTACCQVLDGDDMSIAPNSYTVADPIPLLKRSIDQGMY